MKIVVSEMRAAANLLFDHLESNGCSEIEVDTDYYWNVPSEKLYLVYEEPTELTVGQISEDLLNVKAVVEGRSPPVAYVFVWLASIIRFVGHRVVS
jgi:hypothetical protein